MVLRTLYRVLSPGGPRGCLSVLLFHRVVRERDPLQPDLPDAVEFEGMMRWVAAWFEVVPLEEAAERLRDGSLPSGALSITFDDGYADNESVALPILKRHGLTATFFVASGFVDGGRMWNDTVIEAVRGCVASELDLTSFGLGRHALRSDTERQVAIDGLLSRLKYRPVDERLRLATRVADMAEEPLRNDLMMSTEQLRRLNGAGMAIGGHTVNHPILAALDECTARQEIAQNKEALEGLIREPVRLFAYPNGKPGQDYGPAHVAMVKELGFAAAVSTVRGAARTGSDPYQIPRFTPWDRTAWKFGVRMAQNLARSRYDMA